jgi:hypothetical protein
MAERTQTAEVKAPSTEGSPTPPPRRGPGHRGQDVRDAVAEMAARAQQISQEAGSKMSGALRDVIHAAAGMATFAVESARDLVQYMVRRGQMTQEDADKLIREAEEANSKRKPNGKLPPPPSHVAAAAKAAAKANPPAPAAAAPATPEPAPAPAKAAAKPASKPAAKPASKSAAKTAAKKPAAKKPAAKKTAAKTKKTSRR